MSTPLQSLASYHLDFALEEGQLQPLSRAISPVKTKYIRYSQMRLPGTVKIPSCLACRTSHQKCDHQQPCSHCGIRAIACIYPATYRKMPATKDKVSCNPRINNAKGTIVEANSSLDRFEERFLKIVTGDTHNCEYCRAMHQKCDRLHLCSACKTNAIICSYSKEQKDAFIESAVSNQTSPQPVASQPHGDTLTPLPEQSIKSKVAYQFLDESSWDLSFPESTADVVKKLPPCQEQELSETSVSSSQKKPPCKTQKAFLKTRSTIAANVQFLCQQDPSRKSYQELAQCLQISPDALYRLRTARRPKPQALGYLHTIMCHIKRFAPLNFRKRINHHSQTNR